MFSATVQESEVLSDVNINANFETNDETSIITCTYPEQSVVPKILDANEFPIDIAVNGIETHIDDLTIGSSLVRQCKS
jgi:hypothetical protein